MKYWVTKHIQNCVTISLCVYCVPLAKQLGKKTPTGYKKYVIYSALCFVIQACLSTLYRDRLTTVDQEIPY